VNLIRAEWSRLFARRFTKIMMGVVLLILIVVGLGFAANTHKLTEADYAYARTQIAEQRRYFDQMVADCQQAQERGDTNGKYPPGCNFGEPDFQEEWYLPYQFNFKREVPALVLVAAGVLALFGFVVGASFIGAEWNSGGMMNLLLWRPRRIPVLAAKLGTMLVGVLVVSTVYVGLWIGAFWFIGRTRGRMEPLTSGFWQSLALDGVRALALGLGAAAIGFALASLGRHTAMALGVGIGYALVVEIGTYIIFGLLGTHYSERYRLSTYVGAWLVKKITLYDETPICGPNGCTDIQRYVITWQQGGVVVGTIAVAVLVAAFFVMRRRDVT
jgi:ABC-2 type transport system permease protein